MWKCLCNTLITVFVPWSLFLWCAVLWSCQCVCKMVSMLPFLNSSGTYLNYPRIQWISLKLVKECYYIISGNDDNATNCYNNKYLVRSLSMIPLLIAAAIEVEGNVTHINFNPEILTLHFASSSSSLPTDEGWWTTWGWTCIPVLFNSNCRLPLKSKSNTLCTILIALLTNHNSPLTRG